jgi:glycosyltransferase involved in cell wall biosynthesis
MNPKLNLSVVMITFNEEKNLERCLRRVPQGAEIILLDSHSTDKTREIGKKLGALVYSRTFDNYAAQRNAAIQLATREWILVLDPDERMDSICRDDMTSIVQNSVQNEELAYSFRRPLVFQGKTLRFGRTQTYPVRLFRKNCAEFVDEIHEHLNFTKKTEIRVLKGVVLHFSYPSIDSFFNKFNRYTSLAAQLKFSQGIKISKPMIILQFWWNFITRFIIFGAILDGYEGFVYALLSSFYSFIKYAKLKESLSHGR